jgi:hypothetical protein
MPAPRWLVTTLRLTPAVGGASLLAVAGLALARVVVPLDEVRGSSDEVGNYLQTLGGIYAVLLAFVVFVVWGQFNDVRGFIDREAAALVDLHRTASVLPATTRVEVQRALRGYVDAVLEDEWRALGARDEEIIERVGARLEAAWTALHGCRPIGPCQATGYGEMISRFNDLTELRTNRLSSARARVPLTMRILLYSGALVTVTSMYLLSFERFWIHATVTAALAGAIAHILYLIADLDDAFGGLVQVSRAPFERARRTFGRAEHLVDHEP